MKQDVLEINGEIQGDNCEQSGQPIRNRDVIEEPPIALLREHGAMTPELFMDQAAVQWAKRLGHRNARATNVGRGYGRLELREHKTPSLAVCWPTSVGGSGAEHSW